MHTIVCLPPTGPSVLGLVSSGRRQSGLNARSLGAVGPYEDLLLQSMYIMILYFYRGRDGDDRPAWIWATNNSTPSSPSPSVCAYMAGCSDNSGLTCCWHHPPSTPLLLFTTNLRTHTRLLRKMRDSWPHREGERMKFIALPSIVASLR
jgi:hypothetical protein